MSQTGDDNRIAPKHPVSSVQVGKKDMTGENVKVIYHVVFKKYAIYSTDLHRVRIHYADNEARGSDQRKSLKYINPLRGQINGLLYDWKESGFRSNTCQVFDRRVADALAVALQGDQINSQRLLRQIRADIIKERDSIAGYVYLEIALLAVMIIVFAWIFLIRNFHSKQIDFDKVNEMVENIVWSANFCGLGAFFSMAISFRSRSLFADHQRRDNILDAALRICIGAIAAFILLCILRSDFTSATFVNDGDLKGIY